MDITKPKMLIVDDDDTIRVMLRTLLTLVNFDIIGEARNGTEAVQKILETSPDFVLLDVNMPFKTGDQVLEEIKNKIPDTCVVMVSQISELDIVKKCVDLGAFYYIKKDVAFPQMVQMIQNVWSKFAKIRQQKQHTKIQNLMENSKDDTYQKIVEDKFFFMLFSRGILDKDAWQKLLETHGNGYNALLYLAKENPPLKEELGWFWATAMNCSFINPCKTKISDELIKKLPREVAEKYGIIPLYDIEKSVCVAFSKTLPSSDKNYISQMLWHKDIDFAFSFPEDIMEATEKHYPRQLKKPVLPSVS